MLKDVRFAAVCAALSPDASNLAVHAAHLRETDWEHALGIANRHFVSPTIYLNLQDQGLLYLLPEEVRRFLEVIIHLNTERNREIRAQLAELSQALRNSLVDALVLKGGVQLLCASPERLGERMVGDIDILVRPNQLSNVSSILEKLGYQQRQISSDIRIAGNYNRNGSRASVDLHIQLLHNPQLLPMEELWRDAQWISGTAGLFRCASAEHRILHLTLHEMLHHGGYGRGLRLRALHDLVSFLQKHADETDLGAVCKRLRRHRLLPLLEVQMLAAHRLLGIPWPFSEPPGRAARSVFRRSLTITNGSRLAPLYDGYALVSERLTRHRKSHLFGRFGGSATVRRMCRLARRLVRLTQ